MGEPSVTCSGPASGGDIPGAPFDKGDALSMYRASFLHILAEGDCPGRLAREFMGMLMSKHPDTNLDVQHPDTGASPLMEACQSGNLVIARELIRHGADVNLPDKKWANSVNVLLRGTGHIPCLPDPSGRESLAA